MWNMRHVWPLLKKSKNPEKPVKSGACLLTRLPDELLLLIFSFLHTPDLGRLAQTCKEMQYLTNDFTVWKGRDKKDAKSLVGGINFGPNNPLIPREYRNKIYSYEVCSALTGEGVQNVFDKAMMATEGGNRPKKEKRGIVARMRRVLVR